MNEMDWFDMGSPYDTRSVMHYSSNAFSVSPWWDTLRKILKKFCSNFLAIMREFDIFRNDLSSKTPLVEGVFGNYEMMTSIDSSQLYTMYGCEIFGDFSTESCDNGNILLPERRCDGFIECSDGSDEGEFCLEKYGCCTGSLSATFHNLVLGFEKIII